MTNVSFLIHLSHFQKHFYAYQHEFQLCFGLGKSKMSKMPKCDHKVNKQISYDLGDEGFFHSNNNIKDKIGPSFSLVQQ